MSSASHVQQEKMGPYLGVQTVWDLEQKRRRERGGSWFSSLKTWSSRCSLIHLILTGVSAWFGFWIHVSASVYAKHARATILMSINAAKQVVNVRVCKGRYDWTRCWPTEPENTLVFDVDSWIIKWTTLLLTQRLKSIISWACWTGPQEKHNFKVWHRKWKLYS